MDKLTIARKVASNPNMVVLTMKRDRMWKRLRSDYGRDFMGLDFMELPTDKEAREALQSEEIEKGAEGVNRWTRPERSAYFTLERRIMNLRTALTNHYASV